MNNKKTPVPEYFGGQALLEGVMMQGTQGYAMAVRTPGGRIVYKQTSRRKLTDRIPLLKLPLLRGIVAFCESMYIGFGTLTWSAFQSGEEEEEQMSWKEMAVAIVGALLLTILFFVILPVCLASFSLQYVGPFGRSLLEGLIRIGLFLVYVLAISRLPDIARVFQYHGAEHKTINAWEAGLPLTVTNIKRQSRLNCRCGTSFIFMSLLLMIIVFTFIGNYNPVQRILTKIVAMPLVMGIAYEVFRLPLKFPNNPIVRVLTAPGLWLQKITTKEPTAAQIEVAMAALLLVPAFPGAAKNNLPPNLISEDKLKQEQAGVKSVQTA
ncbi:MAG: DUF1385 domain-containing protein [Firmicutes bacterium]|nr:DUF1385 domain-containing protein [Bacillota bacterium]